MTILVSGCSCKGSDDASDLEEEGAERRSGVEWGETGAEGETSGWEGGEGALAGGKRGVEAGCESDEEEGGEGEAEESLGRRDERVESCIRR